MLIYVVFREWFNIEALKCLKDFFKALQTF